MNNIIKKNTIIVSSILLSLISASAFVNGTNGVKETGSENTTLNTRNIYESHPKIKQIESSELRTFAVIDNGIEESLYVWGKNALGTGAGKDEEKMIYYPMKLSPKSWQGKEIKDISTGNSVSTAIIHDVVKDEDHLYTWGSNLYGGLLMPDVEQNVYNVGENEVVIPGTEDWELKDVAQAGDTVVLTANDGTKDRLFTWGIDVDSIEAGDNQPIVSHTEPVEFNIPLLDDGGEITMLESSERDFTLVINDGSNDHIFSWGTNAKGETGVGYKGKVLTPTEILIGVDMEIVDLEVGKKNGAVSYNDAGVNHVLIWGDNASSQIFTSTNNEEFTPIEIFKSSTEQVTDISLGDDEVFVNYDDGDIEKVYAWGNNFNGTTLGISLDNLDTSTLDTVIYEPTAISIDDNYGDIISIDTYKNHTFVTASNNEVDDSIEYVFAFGLNNNSVLGAGEGIPSIRTPRIIDFNYGNVEEVDSLINKVSFWIMITSFIVLLISIVMFIHHKEVHKNAIEHINDNSRAIDTKEGQNEK